MYSVIRTSNSVNMIEIFEIQPVYIPSQWFKELFTLRVHLRSPLPPLFGGARDTNFFSFCV